MRRAHRVGWTLAALAGLAVLLACVVVMRSRSAPSASATAAVAAAAAPPAATASVARPPPIEEKPAAVAVAAAVAPAASAMPKLLLDVCGVGQVVLQTPPEPDPTQPMTLQMATAAAAATATDGLPPHLGAHPYAQARARLVAALYAGSPRQQAAAWMIDTEVPAKERQAAVAALARSAQDPAIWRWAVSSCKALPGCNDVQPRDWARADPGNVMPWLDWLEVAPAAAPEVWRGLGQATQLQMHHGVLAATALQAWPDGEPRYLTAVLLGEMIGVEGRLALPAFYPLIQACRRPPPAGPDRAQCDAVARALVYGSDNLLGLGIGLQMAKLAGWPADVLKPLHIERARLAGGGPPLDMQPYACDSVARLSDYATSIGRQGELATMRQMVAEQAASAEERAAGARTQR